VSVDSDFFSQLPTHAKIIFAVIIACVLLAMAAKYTFEAMSAVKGKSRRKKTATAATLKNHTFFTRCESWSKYKVNELYFGDDVRNKLFRTIVSSKIETMSTKIGEIIENPELNVMNKKAFQSTIFNLITNMRVETQSRIREKIVLAYPAHGVEIYELVMNHEDRGFNAFNQITDNYTERLVDIICESDIYDDNYEKMEMILDAFKAALGAAFPHIEAAFKGFNGELDQMVKSK
jgi:hypothetical protein